MYIFQSQTNLSLSLGVSFHFSSLRTSSNIFHSSSQRTCSSVEVIFSPPRTCVFPASLFLFSADPYISSFFSFFFFSSSSSSFLRVEISPELQQETPRKPKQRFKFRWKLLLQLANKHREKPRCETIAAGMPGPGNTMQYNIRSLSVV